MLGMSIDPQLRSLNIDIPACPETLVKLSLLMGQEEVRVDEMSSLIEADMALASAIVRAVNSALFGLLHRVETVHEAVRYLGMREVAGITYEMGLRAAFPPGPLLARIWDRAGVRGLAMGRIAQSLDLDPWLAHTGGLFAESGRAVLYAYDRQRYSQVEAAAKDDEAALVAAEIAAFGVSHAALGAALCQSWGLASEVGAFVRARPAFVSDWAHETLRVRRLLAVGAEADRALETSAPADAAFAGRRTQWSKLAEWSADSIVATAERVCAPLRGALPDAAAP